MLVKRLILAITDSVMLDFTFDFHAVFQDFDK